MRRAWGAFKQNWKEQPMISKIGLFASIAAKEVRRMLEQNSSPHLNGSEMEGVERELRELRGLVLRISEDLKRQSISRLILGGLAFGILIAILIS